MNPIDDVNKLKDSTLSLLFIYANSFGMWFLSIYFFNADFFQKHPLYIILILSGLLASLYTTCIVPFAIKTTALLSLLLKVKNIKEEELILIAFVDGLQYTIGIHGFIILLFRKWTHCLEFWTTVGVILAMAFLAFLASTLLLGNQTIKNSNI